MNPPQPMSAFEPNAIFWLEYRQAIRNRLLLGLLLLGFFAPFFFLGRLLLLLYFGWKIASQRINEDMILYTPLSPYQILNGKILFGLLCGALFYLPTLIVASFQAAVMEEFYWLIDVIRDFLTLQCQLIVVIGFMAGAKSTSRAIVLVFLLCVFSLAPFFARDFIFALLSSFGVSYLYDPTSLLWGGVTTLFKLLAAFFAYFIGISGLSSNLNQRKAIAWSITGIFTLCFVIAFGYSLSENFSYNANRVVFLLFFYFCPLIAAASLGGVFQVSSENRLPG